MFNLILNSDHNLIKQVLNEEENACQAEVAPILSEMDNVNKQRNELKDKQKDKKEEDIPTAEKDELNDLDKKWDDLKSKKEAIFIGYASNNKVIRQLIDLALLQNNMLRGEALNNFVKRSIELIQYRPFKHYTYFKKEHSTLNTRCNALFQFKTIGKISIN